MSGFCLSDQLDFPTLPDNPQEIFTDSWYIFRFLKYAFFKSKIISIYPKILEGVEKCCKILKAAWANLKNQNKYSFIDKKKYKHGVRITVKLACDK